jgi:drug/metabolite transporter (DMT)-like permease
MSDTPSKTDHPPPLPVSLGTALIATFTSACWGGTPVAIHYSADTLPPVMIAGIRFALAAVFMLFWCRWEGAGLFVRAGQWRLILVAGGMLFFQIWSFNVGVAATNSSHGSLFINTFIFWVGPIEHFITRAERLTRRKWCGLILAGIAGMSVLLVDVTKPPASAVAAASGTGGHDEPSLFGDLILVLSALILAAKIVYTKHAVRSVEPGKLMFWHDVVGTAMFFSYSFAFETTRAGAFTMPVVFGLLYQGLVVAGLCFAIQAVQLKHHSASQIAVFSASTPLFGIAFGALFRGDVVSPWLVASALGVAWGIWLVTRDEANPNDIRRANSSPDSH